VRRGAAVVVTALAVALAFAAAACEQPKELAGIGRYHVGKLTLAKAPGRCEPTDLPDGRKGMWCYAQPKLGIAGMNADVDLYFGSAEPSSKVIEIQLQLVGCKEAVLLGWLKKNFGVPAEERATMAFWEKASIYVIGELPAPSGRCLVRVLPRSERAEYERLKAAPRP